MSEVKVHCRTFDGFLLNHSRLLEKLKICLPRVIGSECGSAQVCCGRRPRHHRDVQAGDQAAQDLLQQVLPRQLRQQDQAKLILYCEENRDLGTVVITVR